MNAKMIKFVELFQKKQRKKALFMGAIIIVLLYIVHSMHIHSLQSGFKDQVIDMQKEFSAELAKAMKDRERQVNRLQAGISQDNERRWNIIAIEKLIGDINTSLPYETRYEYAAIIIDEISKYSNIEPTLMVSLITQESRFRKHATSIKDAIGLTQVIEETARWICKETGVPYSDSLRYDPKMSIKLGAWYLSYLIDKYDGRVDYALAHYNGGGLQKNRYIYKSMYKNRPEYELSISEIQSKMNALKAELTDEDISNESTEAAKKYSYLRKILQAKKLAPETEAYIPSILNRKKEFDEFMKNPDIYSHIESNKDMLDND